MSNPRRGVVYHGGERISRHYYDLHCLARSEAGQAALQDLSLGLDCVRHARMFFGRPDHDLATAVPGTFAIMPVAGMMDPLHADYSRMAAMIFGPVPAFEEVMTTIQDLDRAVNKGAAR